LEASLRPALLYSICSSPSGACPNMVMSCPASTSPNTAKASRPSSGGPRRERRRNSRGPKRSAAIGGVELDELVKASELVPTGCIQGKNSVEVDFDTVSTAPPSAENSPELAVMASDAEAWPSLMEAAERQLGWDFCSEDSDLEDIWEDLPGPALPLETVEDDADTPTAGEEMAAWLFVPGNEVTEPSLKSSEPESEEEEDEPSKVSFANVVGDQPLTADAVPPAWGTQMPTIRARPLQKRNGAATTNEEDAKDVAPKDADSPDADLDLYKGSQRDKTTRNTKQQRKVDKRKGTKLTQSCRSRGWMAEEGQQDKEEV